MVESVAEIVGVASVRGECGEGCEGGGEGGGREGETREGHERLAAGDPELIDGRRRGGGEEGAHRLNYTQHSGEMGSLTRGQKVREVGACESAESEGVRGIEWRQSNQSDSRPRAPDQIQSPLPFHPRPHSLPSTGGHVTLVGVV